jgi:hypothetical protein
VKNKTYNDHFKFSILILNIIVLINIISCANLNEGAIDYYKTDLTSSMKTNDQCLTLLKKYHRGHPGDVRIHRGDSISIHLQQSFIRSFFETPAYWRGESGNDLRGEIAVVVRAFELKDDQDFDFSPNAAERGRLVFYSDDVRKRQLLNFSFLPIYGPISYEGNPVGIQIYIIELDTKADQLKPLLSELAAAGASLYPPASPVLSLMETLGSALIAGNENDILFRYSLVLHPEVGYAAANYPILEAGHYVFIRKEDRKEELNWDEIALDQLSGRLVKVKYDEINNQTQEVKEEEKEKTQGMAGVEKVLVVLKEYVDETYLIIEVQKGFDPTRMDLAQNTFGKFLESLDKKTVENVKEMELLINNFKDEQWRIHKFGELRMLLSDLKRASEDGVEKRKQLAGVLMASLKEELEQEKEASPEPGTLNPDQIDYLFRNIRYLICDPAIIQKINRKEILENGNFEEIGDPKTNCNLN